MQHRTADRTNPELAGAALRVEAASTLLARGLLGESPLDECSECALIWLEKAVRYLERAAA